MMDEIMMLQRNANINSLSNTSERYERSVGETIFHITEQTHPPHLFPLSIIVSIVLYRQVSIVTLETETAPY